MPRNLRRLIPRRVRQKTARARALPDFFIVGAMKAGTTSLYNYLCAHPRIEGALHKEVHYFTHNHHQSEAWYRAYFPLRLRGLVTGEASTDYLWSAEAPERAAALVPDALIIAMLRDPVERAFSQWKHMVSQGWETLSFEEAVEREEERCAAGGMDAYHFSYLSRGRYLEQIRRWEAHYPRERILIHDFEELRRDPEAVYWRTCAYLGLRPHDLECRPYNQSTDRSEMNPEMEERLRPYFREHNEALEEHLGRRFYWNQTPHLV